MWKTALVVGAVLATARPASAFDTWWHAVETQQACAATGFSDDARLVLQVENYLTDMIAGVTSKVEPYPAMLGLLYSTRLLDEGYDYLHFDALWNVEQISANYDKLEKNTLVAIEKYSKIQGTGAFRMAAMMTALAASMHAVQDFYSHSNWVNYWMEHGGNVPLWFEVSAEDRAKLPIHTGAYPDGSAPGHENHADLNKDSSSRKYNMQAVDAASRASADWINRLMADNPSLPWGEMKAYTVKDDQIMKGFLYDFDATFLTSSSIAMGHFDGSDPHKYVFGANKDGDAHGAKIALAAVIERYLVYMHVDKVNSLPTPYWSSHFIYHVPRDIAAGLMVAGKTYVRAAN
jgi:hypothetical protein